MDINEKAGDLLIDIAKLIIGSVILASIIAENVNTIILFIGGSVCSFALIFLGFYLYKKRKMK
ncbi:MAG: hypothetical protein LBR50_03165 [Tannerella sp.]|nr:hypothetical protein [Tannerella sp.]